MNLRTSARTRPAPAARLRAWTRLLGLGVAGLLAATAPLTAHASNGAIELAAGLHNYGAPFVPAQAAIDGDMVIVDGLVRLDSNDASDWQSGTVVATLAEGFRPLERLRFTLDQHGVIATVDVTADGEIIFISGTSNYPWLSLSGIAFSTLPADEQSAVHLRLPKLTPVSGYQRPRYHKEGDLISVGGMARFPNPIYWQWYTGGVMAELSGTNCPTGQLIFTVTNGHTSARVDVTDECEIVFKDGNAQAPSGSWASLASVRYHLNGTPLDPCPGFVNYGHGYAELTYDKEGDTVSVQGLVEREGSTWHYGDVIAVLPPGHRPANHLIFTVNQHGRTARVDVQPNGNIIFNTGWAEMPWLSLSGIVFQAAQ